MPLRGDVERSRGVSVRAEPSSVKSHGRSPILHWRRDAEGISHLRLRKGASQPGARRLVHLPLLRVRVLSQEPLARARARLRTRTSPGGTSSRRGWAPTQPRRPLGAPDPPRSWKTVVPTTHHPCLAGVLDARAPRPSSEGYRADCRRFAQAPTRCQTRRRRRRRHAADGAGETSERHAARDGRAHRDGM